MAERVKILQVSWHHGQIYSTPSPWKATLSIMDRVLLDNLQHVELIILHDFHSYCEAHDIRYSLYAGTMLGAVRHQGFIPWDDDIDVCMTRNEYKRFKQAWQIDPMHGYFFENYETDQYCGTCHGKLRKLNTVLLQEGDMEEVGHHEIWLDIFPLDKMPLGKDRNKTRRFGRQLVLLTRANVRRTMDSIVVRFARGTISLIPKFLRRHLLITRTRWLERQCDIIEDGYTWSSMSTLSNIDMMQFPKAICESYTTLTFEDQSFMAFKNYSEMLSIIYGNYMELPPAEERVCRHAPVKVSF